MESIIGYGGGKGGDGGGGAQETPDSLHSTSYANVLDLVSEGEVRGLVDGMKSVFLNKTPVINADGSSNFSNVTIDVRTGTQAQDIIAGFPSVENEIAVGVQLKYDTPYTQTFTNLVLSAVRVRLAVPALSQADTTNGSIGGYRIAYQVQLKTDDGPFVTAVDTAFDGKTTTEYQRSHRIELPRATTGWVLRVVRLTPQANSSAIADTTNVVSTTQVIDAKLRYPMSAIVGTKIDASQFQAIPSRAFDMYGRIVQIPSNYDPDARTYTGVWDGTLKPGWTNNPAWIFYDIVLNDRYGLGARVNASQIDRYALYNIGMYCDVSVPDGFGGMEPRMTCNVYIQQQADAYKVLQDLATVFRGIGYWAGGRIIASSDMPGDPDYTYTKANVIGGKFTYVGSPLKSRYTVAMVTWNDPQDFYSQKVETVQDQEGLARYGLQQTSITAFGCTSRAQAQRIGLWTTLTSRYETGTVTFSVGLDGNIAMPGDVVRIADSDRMGRRNGGRIKTSVGRVITIDKAPTIIAGDNFSVNMPDGTSQTRVVESVNGNAITVALAFSMQPTPDSVWTVDNTDLFAPTYRILTVTEKDEMTFEIEAVRHEPGKYAAIDSGLPIDKVPETVVPGSVQVPPTNVAISSYNVLDQGIQYTNMVITWDAADKAVSYQAEWKRGNDNWVLMPLTGQTSIELHAAYSGDYLARVRAINSINVKSMPALSVLTTIVGKTTPPPSLLSLTTTSILFGIKLDWTIPPAATDTQRTELWYSPNPTGLDPSGNVTMTKLTDLAYPQVSYIMSGLAAGALFFFWGRLVDRSGNIGPFYPVSPGVGVSGQSSSNADDILGMLAGKIGETELAQDLLRPIEQIPVIINRLDVNADTLATSTIKTSIANDTATATAKVVLQAGIDNNTALVTSESTARANGDSALGTRVDVVQAQTVVNSSNISLNAAAITNETTARTDAVSALATQVTTVAAQTTVNTGNISTNAAAIVSETTARTSADSALGSRVDTVQAQTGTNTANISTNATAISTTNGQLSAMYSIKTQVTSDGRTYVAGIGVGVTNGSGIIESQVLVSADRFAVINASGSGVTAPFVIQGGQTFISQALIGTGWITNAMIGNTIQSTAVNPYTGAPVWYLDKSGTFQMNGSNSTPGRLVMNSQNIQIFDDSNVLRVKLGAL